MIDKIDTSKIGPIKYVLSADDEVIRKMAEAIAEEDYDNDDKNYYNRQAFAALIAYSTFSRK